MLRVDRKQLNGDRIVVVAENAADDANSSVLVSCGIGYRDCDIRIVHPQRCGLLAEDQVGEIWVNSSSVATAYLNQPQLTQATFNATTVGDDSGRHFLRTGDLGFIHQGQLFVTGRWKDLIITGGRNHYPQDIEFTVSRAGNAVSGWQVAAFAVEVDAEERLVVVMSCDPTATPLAPNALAAIVAQIKRSVTREHGISLYDLVVTKSRLPFTSSGKIQRKSCQQRYLHGDFDTIFTLLNDGVVND